MKYYIPSDNSYSVDVSEAKPATERLAGDMMAEMPKVCKVIAGPFPMNCHNTSTEVQLRDMILVDYQGKAFTTLFYTENLYETHQEAEKDLERRCEIKKQQQKAFRLWM